VSFYGYVFPYLEVSNRFLKRCFWYDNEICCFKVSLTEDLFGVKDIFGECPKDPLNMLIDLKSNKILKDKAKNFDLNFPDIEKYALVWSPDWFEILTSAIISQNTSFIGFRNMLKNFVKTLGIKIKNYGYVFPRPNDIIEKKQKLNKLRLGYRAKWILEVSEFFKNNKPPSKGKTDELIKELVKVKGIGLYTASSFSLFHLKRYDTPLWDRFIAKKIMSDILGYKVNSFSEFKRLTRELWGEYRGLILAALVSVYYRETKRKRYIWDIF